MQSHHDLVTMAIETVAAICLEVQAYSAHKGRHFPRLKCKNHLPVHVIKTYMYTLSRCCCTKEEAVATEVRVMHATHLPLEVVVST